MTRRFGVLIPSTNTTVELECRLLPAAYQAHVGRLMTSTPGRTFSPSRDEDIEYQARLLGTAKVELVILAQTSASLFADDYDDVVTRRMSAGAGAPSAPHRRRLALFGRGEQTCRPLLPKQARARDGHSRRVWRDRFLRDRPARAR